MPLNMEPSKQSSATLTAIDDEENFIAQFPQHQMNFSDEDGFFVKHGVFLLPVLDHIVEKQWQRAAYEVLDWGKTHSNYAKLWNWMAASSCQTTFGSKVIFEIMMSPIHFPDELLFGPGLPVQEEVFERCFNHLLEYHSHVLHMESIVLDVSKKGLVQHFAMLSSHLDEKMHLNALVAAIMSNQDEMIDFIYTPDRAKLALKAFDVLRDMDEGNAFDYQTKGLQYITSKLDAFEISQALDQNHPPSRPSKM